jgi:hypothetical protein
MTEPSNLKENLFEQMKRGIHNVISKMVSDDEIISDISGNISSSKIETAKI